MGHWHPAPQITHTDTSSANTNITAAPQITRADTSSTDTTITAAPQITLTDTSSADTNITAETQITLSDTSSAETNITAATTSQLDTLSKPILKHSPLWRALRRHRRRLPTVADGCGRKRQTWRTQPHPQTPKWNGNPRYAFGKKPSDQSWGSIFSISLENVDASAPTWGLLESQILLQLRPSWRHAANKLCPKLPRLIVVVGKPPWGKPKKHLYQRLSRNWKMKSQQVGGWTPWLDGYKSIFFGVVLPVRLKGKVAVVLGFHAPMLARQRSWDCGVAIS